MAGYPSNKDGAGDDGSFQPDSGLDAKLDRAVMTGDADAFLVGVGGSHGGRVYPLSYNTIFIGRADDADVTVSDPSVSARHARLINGSQGFEIEDLSSTNGTFLEGRRVVRARLKSGDRLAFGQIEFKFLVDRRVDATMTVIPPGIPAGAARGAGGALTRYEPPRPRERVVGTMPMSSAPAKDDDEGPSLAEIIERLVRGYQYVRRNALLIGSLAGAGVLLGLISIVALPSPREAVCLVKLQPQAKTNPFDQQGWRPSGDDDEVHFFQSAEVAFVQPELISTTFKTLYGITPVDGTVMAIGQRLKFESLPDRIYRATYREPWFGALKQPPTQFLSTHLEGYLHGEINRALRVFTAQVEFLRNQLATVDNEMKAISNEKVSFSLKNSDRLPDEATQMVGSRFTLETRRAELVAQVRRLQGELEAQRHALSAEGPLAQTKFQSSQVYREQLATINAKLTDAYARGLADGHPEVRQLKDGKQRIEAMIEKEMQSDTTQTDRRSNAGYQELQNRVALLQAELNAARGDLSDTETNLGRVRNVVGDLPRVQESVQELAHRQDDTTRLHGQLFEQLKKAELQLNLERVSAESRYELVSPPRLSEMGVMKTMAIRMGLGLFVGLFVAAIVLGIRELKRLVKNSVASLNADHAASR